MSVLTRSNRAITAKSLGELPAGTSVVKGAYLFDIGMLAAMVGERLCWVDENSMAQAIEKMNEIYVQLPPMPSETERVGGIRIQLTQLAGFVSRPWVEGSCVYGNLYILTAVNGSFLYQMYRDNIGVMYKPYCKAGNLVDVFRSPGAVDIEIDSIVYLTPIVPPKNTELQPIYVERG